MGLRTRLSTRALKKRGLHYGTFRNDISLYLSLKLTDLVEPPADDGDVVAPGGDKLVPGDDHVGDDVLILPPPVAADSLPEVGHAVTFGLRLHHAVKVCVGAEMDGARSATEGPRDDVDAVAGPGQRGLQGSGHVEVTGDDSDFVLDGQGDSLGHNVTHKEVSEVNVDNLEVENDHLKGSVSSEGVHPLPEGGDGRVLPGAGLVDVDVVLSDEREDHVPGA